MVFSSTTFLFMFLPALLLLYFCGRDLRWRNAILLIFSLFFYAWGEPVWIFGMIAVTLVNWALALLIRKTKNQLHRRLLLALSVIVSLSLLFWFKYSSFLFNTFAALFGSAARVPSKHLPVGISFYTFQVLTYTVDVYRKKARPQKNPLYTLLYISCFPQLIAGPIVQYADVAEALTDRKTSATDFLRGMQRIVLGLAKKILIADVCYRMLLDLLTISAGPQSFMSAWTMALLFSLRLYFDFSAYSDIAIGLGRIFGFRYMENFDHPYISKSIVEFWRRWHISLSRFFRDYVYIPLGGNRKGVARTILNLTVVWVLTGLWHGANWNFVLWGVYYLVLLLLERFVLKDALLKIPAWIRHIGSLILIAVGWVIFAYDGVPIADKQLVLYTPDFAALGKHLLALIGLSGTNGLHFLPFADKSFLLIAKRYTVLPVLFMVCCLPLKDWFGRFFAKNERRAFWGELLGALVLTALFVVSVIFLIRQSSVPNIYYNF
ncbi:MAG: MBOAT family O-acyltransferase [Clostridia bacterium]|nr:MBOAT family O-acyltransferase [Clostridia bacterium]